MKICEECGKGYNPNKYRVAAQRFCCDICSDKWWNRNTRNNAPLKKCDLCSKEYPAYKSKKDSESKYCSKECQLKAVNNIRRIYYCSTCGKVMQNYSKYCSEKCKTEKRVCEYCKNQFEVKKHIKRTICDSRECRLKHKRNRWHDCAKERHAAVVGEITCAECGKVFTPEYGSKKRVYCSKKCSVKRGKRIGKATRRARKRGNGYEYVDPISILNRDKWTCQLCGAKTPKILRGTIEDNAPEVDHIIPLAAGGNHVAHNLQCTCRKCNNTKSDNVAGQLILFAGVDYNGKPQKADCASRA